MIAHPYQASLLGIDMPPAASAMAVLTWAVAGVFFAAVLLFILLIVFRFVFAKRERKIEVKKERIRPLVYELITGDTSPEEVVATLSSVIPRRDRRVLEKVLMENARLVTGREMRILSDVYEEMGYAEEDIRNLQKTGTLRRAESAFHLGTMRAARATPYLREALSPESPEVEFSCLNALSKIGTVDAVKAVVDYLASSSKIETLRLAEVILERKQSFAPYLEDLLRQKEPDAARLKLLIELVGAMKDPGSVAILLEFLDHPDPRIRSSTAFALGSIGDSIACEDLTRSMDDEDAGVRSEAALSAGKIQCDEAIGRLSEGLSDPELTVKMNSAIALSQLGEEGHAALEAGLSAVAQDERGVAAEILDRQSIRGNRKGE